MLGKSVIEVYSVIQPDQCLLIPAAVSVAGVCVLVSHRRMFRCALQLWVVELARCWRLQAYNQPSQQQRWAPAVGLQGVRQERVESVGSRSAEQRPLLSSC